VKTEAKVESYHTMKTVVILILAMAGSLFLPACKPASDESSSVGYWSGLHYETVQIRVISDKDGKPISGVRVWLLTADPAYAAYLYYQSAVAAGAVENAEKFTKKYGAIEGFGSRVFTDSDGKTAIWTPFKVSGGRLADSTRITVNRYVEGFVIVESRSYEHFESELNRLLPSSVMSDAKAPISITIRLKEKAAKQQ